MYEFILAAVRELTLERLVMELDSVVDWFHFGLCLGVHDSQLNKIRVDYKDANMCKTQVLMEWMNMTEGSWSHIIQALVGIKRRILAMKIAEKYGRFYVVTK